MYCDERMILERAAEALQTARDTTDKRYSDRIILAVKLALRSMVFNRGDDARNLIQFAEDEIKKLHNADKDTEASQ